MYDYIFKNIREGVKHIDRSTIVPYAINNTNNIKKPPKCNVKNDKYYVLINKQTEDIIHLDPSRNYYYRTINSLCRAYKRCLNSTNIPIDDIGFKELKFTQFDLSDDDNIKLMNCIQNNSDNCSNKLNRLFTQVVKMNGRFYIHFIKEDKSIDCWVRCYKSKRYIKKGARPGFYVEQLMGDWRDSYYYAETMSKLRELLLSEVKKGNIEIPEAGLFVED